MAETRVSAPVKGNITFSVLNIPQKLQNGLSFAKSTIQDLKYSYPLKLMVPEHASSSNCQWLYIVTFGGGIVQGDNYEISVNIKEHAAVLVTTQSATKVFDCDGDLKSRQTLTFHVAPFSFLAVLPDPVMCFSEAAYSQTQDIHMNDSSTIILLDWLYAGRVARGEIWDFTSFESRCRIHLNNSTVFKDGLVLKNTPFLSIKKSMDKYKVVGNLIIIGNLLSDLSKNLCQELNKPKNISDVYENGSFLSASPLNYKVDKNLITGCVLRFAMQTTEEAYAFLDRILKPVYGILGGNPFLNK